MENTLLENRALPFKIVQTRMATRMRRRRSSYPAGFTSRVKIFVSLDTQLGVHDAIMNVDTDQDALPKDTQMPAASALLLNFPRLQRDFVECQQQMIEW